MEYLFYWHCDQWLRDIREQQCFSNNVALEKISEYLLYECVRSNHKCTAARRIAKKKKNWRWLGWSTVTDGAWRIRARTPFSTQKSIYNRCCVVALLLLPLFTMAAWHRFVACNIMLRSSWKLNDKHATREKKNKRKGAFYALPGPAKSNANKKTLLSPRAASTYALSVCLAVHICCYFCGERADNKSEKYQSIAVCNIQMQQQQPEIKQATTKACSSAYNALLLLYFPCICSQRTERTH